MIHLNEEYQKIAQLEAKERIRNIETIRWVGYTRAQQILKRLDHLLEYPRSNRMPNVLIIGETNNGKTEVLKTFTLRHRPTIHQEGRPLPVLMIEAPEGPNLQEFYNIILRKLMASFRVSERVDKKKYQIMELFHTLGVKMLIIDELQNVLHGSYQKLRLFLTTLKSMANQLEIVIVCAGIIDASRALYSDPQLANRFETFSLPKWILDEEYIRLLMSLELTLPLRQASNLYKQKDLADYILTESEGLIGEITMLVRGAAIIAIESGEERITGAILKRARYVSPKKRKELAESSLAR